MMRRDRATPQAGEGKPSKPLEEVFHDRLTAEHDFISNRMTWLMALNGFLAAGSTILAANAEKFDGSFTLNGGIFLIAVLGAMSNASCLFSNYWATVAIRGAGEALLEAWRDLSPDVKGKKVSRMRLYGRDPLSFRRKGRALTWWMHPWLLLPGLFLVVFAVLPFMSAGISRDDRDLPWVVQFIPLALLTTFVVLPAVEAARKRRER
ncbi:hypothetical protein AB2L27_00245 [Kineococcus sp. LSe6-4]|uniref:Uncharacterized protein n=1 Tax=Kineococcus halophytocola TaxID=3234027 RepID=A0ABV4GWF5_9ACTN